MGAKIVRRLPTREEVFMWSLQYHGFRFTHKRKNLKLRNGYVIPSTRREDAVGVDFFVKIPGSMEILPVQVTQYGVAIYKLLNRGYTPSQLAEFVRNAEERLRRKRKMCRRNGVIFVLVRDHLGPYTNRAIAWGDVKALRHALNIRKPYKKT